MGWNVKHPCLPQYANKFSSPYFIASLKIVMPWPILPPLQNNNVPHQSQLILNKYIALGSGLWTPDSGHQTLIFLLVNHKLTL